jgi:DnaJ-class molecular chaperone
VCVQAYKKLAMQWHPDKFQDEEDKKTAEKKFMDIAAAKEVLLDEGTYVRTSVNHCFILRASVLT